MRAGLPKRERMPSCSRAKVFMPVCGRTSKKALSGRFKNRTSWVRFLTRVCSANSGTYGVSGVHAERTRQTPCLPQVFPANYGGMAFLASMPERIKGLFLGESTGRMPVQGKVRLLLPSVADYPALFECTKKNCLFTVRVWKVHLLVHFSTRVFTKHNGFVKTSITYSFPDILPEQ